MISIQALGNVGGQPEIKASNSGKRFARFSLASNKVIKGEKITTWTNVTVFDEFKIDIIEKYVSQGDKLFIEGEPQARGYTDKSGEAKASLDVVLGYGSKLVLCGRSGSDSDQTAGAPAKADGYDSLNDEVPF